MAFEFNVGSVDISTAVSGKISVFIDYSIIIVLILAVYFTFRFLTEGRPNPSTDDDAAERREKFRQWFDKKREDSETADKATSRDKEVKFAESRLVKAVEYCDELVRAVDVAHAGTTEAQRRTVSRNAKSKLGLLQTALTDATHQFKRMRRGVSDRKYAWIDKLYAYSGTTLSAVEHIKIPEANESEADWTTHVQEVKTAIQGDKVRGQCGHLIDRLHKFTKDETYEDTP